MDLHKIDELIAEKVFGLMIKDTSLPKYSSDISAAFLVVEQLQLPFRIENNEDSSYSQDLLSGNWHCDIWPLDGDVACVSAKAAPLAICLAALKALGVECVTPQP